MEWILVKTLALRCTEHSKFTKLEEDSVNLYCNELFKLWSKQCSVIQGEAATDLTKQKGTHAFVWYLLPSVNILLNHVWVESMPYYSWMMILRQFNFMINKIPLQSLKVWNIWSTNQKFLKFAQKLWIKCWIGLCLYYTWAVQFWDLLCVRGLFSRRQLKLDDRISTLLLCTLVCAFLIKVLFISLSFNGSIYRLIWVKMIKELI